MPWSTARDIHGATCVLVYSEQRQMHQKHRTEIAMFGTEVAIFGTTGAVGVMQCHSIQRHELNPDELNPTAGKRGCEAGQAGGESGVEMVANIMISDDNLNGDGCLREGADEVPESSHDGVPLRIVRLAACVGEVPEDDECVGAQLAVGGAEYGAHERLPAHAVHPGCVRAGQVEIGYHHDAKGGGGRMGCAA